MRFGALFRRGFCRCGSASDLAPLNAQAVAPVRGGDPALGPAFGPLPAPLAAWKTFTDGPVSIVYTTDAAAHRFHALAPEACAAPGSVPEACVVADIDLGRLTDPAHPAQVQRTARMAAHSLAVFRDLGFRVPDTLTIRLCTFGREKGANYRGGTEVWLDHVWVSTRLSDADALLTVAHEVFHRVQYLYNATSNKTSPLYAALREGGARLAEDWVLDSGDRYLKDGSELLGDPGRPLLHHAAPGGEIAPHSYAAALFWRWLCEQHGERAGASDFGHEVMRTVLERMVDDSGYILQDLREARGLVYGEGHLDRFQHLDVAGGETLSTETDWGNFLVANWLHGTGKPTPDLRFDYVEDDAGDGAFSGKRPFVWPGEALRAEQLPAKPYSFVIPGGAVRAGFAARYNTIDVTGSSPPLVQLDFEVQDGMEDPLVQVLMVSRDADGREKLKDLIRSDRTRWSTVIPTKGLAQIVVIVAAREKPGRYRLALSAAAGQAVLHVAPCNAAAGTSFETDPRAGAWPWTSPDVALDGTDIRIRVTNRGDVVSGQATVALAAQGTTADVPLKAAAWRPVGDGTLPPIEPGATATLRIPWQAPAVPKAATGWGLRATVTDEAGGERLVVLSSVGALARPRRFDTVL
ncbi:hypothetical protein GXW78_00620 [Roseomonas terrae]|uniref:Alpha-galactosidase NEW3 domain-containing protein n=1 Tax=Neoroseomonas terrae TaxID=424799 RepID=A0ABS5EAV8_9PROT|nr:hypothetical protein [Neoroseomonas terrae]MBR0648150.1 hypothetical protein [Neoroseomonas terrae]